MGRPWYIGASVAFIGVILIIIGVSVGIPQKHNYDHQPWVDGMVTKFIVTPDADRFYHTHVVLQWDNDNKNCTFEICNNMYAAEWQAIDCAKSQNFITQNITVLDQSGDCIIYDGRVNDWLLMSILATAGLPLGFMLAVGIK
ncbi:MAG: hypothetical protein Faunusvirus50_4 [Faunusvirus sp.]|jgi:hypothetical protein|uniref:Uncharacterized protein n=1 Tax=Faunusvirus sp. TaxID=2487766 RepID=A0A3G4ZXY8_9VIRU|nr:MAG: hypothetical protein Faunusvirus50_4 [Faunusvirus sp.]